MSNDLFRNFSGDAAPKRNIDFVNKGVAYTPDEGYYPTAIIVACTKCKIVGTVDFPKGFDPKSGDSLMAGRVTKGFCLKCRGMTEFRPITPKELGENRFAILKHYHDLYKRLVVEKKGAAVTEDEVLTALTNAQKETIAKGNQDAADGGQPKIIVP